MLQLCGAQGKEPQMKSGKAYRAVLAGAITIGLLASAGFAMAQQAAPPPAPGQQQRLLTPEDREAMAQIFWHRMQAQLGLSDQQVTDIRSAVQAQRQGMRTDFLALRDARKHLRELMQTPSADAGAIQSAAAQVSQLQGKLFTERINNQLALRAKLTPDQLAKWIELRKTMHPRWGGKRGMHGGMGFGPGL
jgi:Spy/CpxP family protein refolding chaperone